MSSPRLPFGNRGLMLSALAQGGPLRGAEVARACGMSAGGIYAALQRMQEQGLVEKRWHITELGRDMLATSEGLKDQLEEIQKSEEES